jgi:hypothetical protein
MLVRDLLIGIIVFSMVAVSGGLMVGEMNTAYGGANKTLNENFTDTYNNIADMQAIANTSSNTLTSNDTTITPLADFTAVIKGGWSIIKLGFGSISTAATITNDVTDQFLGRETFGWLAIAIVSIIAIIIIFTIVSAVFRQRL